MTAVRGCQPVILSVALGNVQQGVTQDNVSLIFTSPVLYLVFYNVC